MSGAKAALEDKYGADRSNAMMKPLVDCTLKAFTRGLLDSISSMIEARNSKTIK